MSEEFVNVLVPKSRVLEVYALLGQPEGSPVHGGSGGDSGRPVEGKGYDRALFERAYRESSPHMKRLLEYLADNPGRMIPSGELAEAIGYDRSQLAGVLGAFGRRWKNRYKNPGHWPFRADNPVEFDGYWAYWMEPEEVEIINEIRDAK